MAIDATLAWFAGAIPFAVLYVAIFNYGLMWRLSARSAILLTIVAILVSAIPEGFLAFVRSAQVPVTLSDDSLGREIQTSYLAVVSIIMAGYVAYSYQSQRRKRTIEATRA